MSGDRLAISKEPWRQAVSAGYDQGRFEEIVALSEVTLEEHSDLIENTVAGFWGVYDSSCAAALLAADEAGEASTAERTRTPEPGRQWLESEGEVWISWLQRGGERAGAAGERASWEKLRSRIEAALEEQEER